MLFGISTALVTALALILVPHRPLSAQANARVQVALVDSLSRPDARAEVIRFSTGRPDLILLRSSTVKSEDIVLAIAAWEQSRGERPTPPGQTARLTVVGHGQATELDRRSLRRAAFILRELKAAPAVRIGNVGRGRWGEFDVRE